MSTSLPYAIVLIATISHAYWNFLLKRAGGGQLLVGSSKIAETVLFAPVFLAIGARDAVAHAATLWPLIIVGAALTLSNYVLLGLAYQRGDLAFVYPISRGAILAFVPAMGWLAFDEHLDPRGVVAIVAILGGIIAVSRGRAGVQPAAERDPGVAVALAVLAALAAAGYTIWDKRAVGIIAPFTYFYSYSVLVAVAYSVYLGRAYSAAEHRAAWREHGWTIVQIGVFNTVTYLLVLFALRDGVSSYVVAIRQLG